jgi:glyoxylase-like metal-dependent hydrolase (beta-lactamase superfamily II)
VFLGKSVFIDIPLLFLYIIHKNTPVKRILEKETSLLINQVWQPLPGTRRSEIYPYLRKPDLLSSNSCVIRTPQQIILIDAGALAAQTADLARILKECDRERSRPVIIYLTHCHIDHSLQVGSHRQILTSTSVWIAIQEEGADYLIEGNRRKTIAELYGVNFPSMQSDIRLLTAQDRQKGARRRINLAPGVWLTLQTLTVPTNLEQPLIRQTISMGGGDNLEIYPAPGHSPDSICIRAGEILFIGDLLAAANPMVAGISGWNRDHLVATLQQTQWLLDNMPIQFCYPGHGTLIPADKARDILQRLRNKICRTGDVVRMNEERLFQITDFALGLIDEAEEVFSAIAGRLLYVAYQLERLEEEDAAQRCRTTMQMDHIDACLLEFRNLCRLLDAGKIRRVEFAHGALHIVEKMKTLFDPRPLSAILPQSLINRGTRLLLDFIGVANGYRNLEEFIPTDVNALIADVVRAWHTSPHEDTSVIDQADDYEKYLAALVLRIGHEPLASRPALYFSPTENLPFIRVAAGRLFDTLMNFLEWLKQAHPSSITIGTGLDHNLPFIVVEPAAWNSSSLTPHDEKKINSFCRRFLMCGMILQQGENGFRLILAEDQDECE